ncbi:unnamed protein product [Closterium sp. NIES-54]
MITSFDHLTTTALTSPSEPGAAARVMHGVRRILSNWDNFILQPRQGDLVMLRRMSPGSGLLPSFMVKLFWKRMDKAAEGEGVGGGAGHEGGGEGAPRVVVEYSYEEEEEIKEDTSRQAQHGVVELLQRVTEVEASQKKLGADVFAKHCEQAVVFNKLAGDFRTAWNMISESSKSTLKQCGDVVNGVTVERKLLEGAYSKLDEMSGKIIEGVAAAITKASEDAVEKQLKLVEERLVASVVKGIEKVVEEDLFYSTLLPESMKELKDVVKESYQEAEAGRLEVLTEAMAIGFRGSAGPSTRSRQEEGVAGFRSGVERRVHGRSVPPSPSVGGHVGSPVASPPSRARQTVGKSVEDKDEKGWERSGCGGESGAPIGQVAPAGKGAVEKRGAPIPSGGAVGKGAGEKRGALSQVAVAAGLLSKTKADSAVQLCIAGRPVEPVGKRSSSVLGDVSLSGPGSRPPSPRPRSPFALKKRQAVTKSTKRAAEATESSDVEMASTVVAARHEKSKKPKVIGYAPPPPPDD